MLIRWVVIILVALIMFWVVGKFTGSNDFGKETKDDERSELIKQKAIVGSWVFMLVVFVINIVFDFFDLKTGLLKNIPFNQPELFYLLVLVGSYLVYYVIYSRRMSGNEK